MHRPPPWSCPPPPHLIPCLPLCTGLLPGHALPLPHPTQPVYPCAKASSLVMPSTNGNGKAHLPTPADEAVHAILQPLKTFG